MSEDNKVSHHSSEHKEPEMQVKKAKTDLGDASN